MQKTAQKRSILNRLREKTNVGGIAAEKFFNPEFERVMNSLREADNKIRAVASGTDIEGEDAGTDPVSLKDLLKNAKSNLNRREYMTALAFLGRFHKKVESISKFVEALKFDVEKVHDDFLFKDLDEEHRKHLQEMKGRFARTSKPSLVAEAGIMDFLANIGTERGRALSAWEKRYPNKVKQIKKDITHLYSKSEVMLSHILSALKEMATFRATRKVDHYMQAATKIAAQYAKYDTAFKDYYSSNLKDFLSKQEFSSPTKKVEDKDLGTQEVNVEEAGPDGQRSPALQSTIPVGSSDLIPNESVPPSSIPFPLVRQKSPALTQQEVYDALKAPKIPPAPEIEEEAPATIPSAPLSSEEVPILEKHPELPPTAAHKSFYNSLTKMGKESPQVLYLYISKYAKSIQNSDPETAIQLLKIAKTIKVG